MTVTVQGLVTITAGAAQTFVQRAELPLLVRCVLVDASPADISALQADSLLVGTSEHLMRPIALPLLLQATLRFVWEPACDLSLRIANHGSSSARVRFALGCARVARGRPFHADDELERVVVALELPKVAT
ncbi:MAG TPA: hypothetical protein VJR89_35775 [Polyangiales bacterium]|nr:hypothetical protein [Polyangiales bacterium]